MIELFGQYQAVQIEISSGASAKFMTPTTKNMGNNVWWLHDEAVYTDRIFFYDEISRKPTDPVIIILNHKALFGGGLSSRLLLIIHLMLDDCLSLPICSLLCLPWTKESMNAKSSQRFQRKQVNNLSMTRLSVHLIVGQGLREIQRMKRWD